jgi:hypothetical protein
MVVTTRTDPCRRPGPAALAQAPRATAQCNGSFVKGWGGVNSKER